jgi:hypothetical protein
MSLPQLTTDLNIIQALDDEPNDVGGLSSAQLKAKFDEAVGYIKTYLNDTLLPYLESVSGAGDIGITTVSGIQAATNVQDALAALEANIEGVTQGAVADNSINTVKLVDSSITNAKLADNSVSTVKLQDDAVTNAKMANNAVDTAELVDGAVTTAKLADGAVTTVKLADGAVTTAKVAAGAISNSKLANSSVVADNIAANAVTTAKILNGAVTNEKIAEGTLSSTRFADGSVLTAKIADGAVTNAKMASGAAVANIGYTPQKLHSTVTVTLAAAGWSNNQQTGVAATGVTASNTVFVAPDPTDYADYTDAAIRCTGQGAGTLDFACDTEPASDITVNVVILGV